MNNAQLINQDSGDYECYTPSFIIEAAREVMGSIDFDPASSAEANETVKAERFLNANGLDAAWSGNVWLNHPFSRKNNPLWIRKAVDEYEANQGVEQLCCITYAATSELWFKPLHNYLQCYLIPRTNYYLPDGTKKKGVTKGSVVTYMGPYTDIFETVFQEYGAVK